MKRTLIHAALLVGAILLVILPTLGQTEPESKESDLKTDPNQPQSPPRPAPPGLTFIDQGKHDKRLEGYRTPAGFKVEIVAEDPTIINPVGMTFADDGTPYVLEWVPSPGDEWREATETFKFKDGTVRKVATMRKKKKDLVKVLISSKKNGIFDKSKVILEDELPSSILLHDGWLYLSGRGTVRRYRQSTPGGAWDKKEIIAQGFCGFHHHQVSGMTIGNDGWLYITAGDDDNIVEGSDGSRATVLRTGAIFRCKPDGSKLHAFAMGFRNPYRDIAFDIAGNMFHADNDNEDNSRFMGCRLMHIPEGADFGWRLYSGARCCRPDFVRGAAFGERPGKMPALLKTGRGAPAGLLIYNDTRLPEEYRGLLFQPDVYRRMIRAYKVEQAGASFKVTEEFKFMTADKDDLFRPCQMVLGPDGAIYIVDWRTNSGGAGRLWGDGVHGRIYRVSWSGTADKPALPLRGLDAWAKIAKLSDKEVIETLSSEEASDRERARRELVKRGDKNRKTLIKLLTDDEVFLGAKLAALGALQSMFDATVQTAFEKALKDGDTELQCLAAQALALCAKKGDRNAHTALLQALAAPDFAVRRAVAIAMGRLAAPGAGDTLASTLSFDDSKDVFLRDGILRGLELLGKPGIDALLALADSGVQKDTDRVVEAFLGLRTRPAFDAIPTLLKHMHVDANQRAELIRSCTNYLLDPPVSLEPIVAWVASQPKETTEVKKALLEVLATPGTVKGPKADDLVLSLLKDSHLDVRLLAIGAAEQMRLGKAGSILLKRLGEEKVTNTEKLAILQSLRVLSAKEAGPTLQSLVTNEKLIEAVRREAFRTLAAVDPVKGAAAARVLLTGKEGLAGREAVAVLGTTAEGARYLGKVYLEKKLPRSLLFEVSEALRKHLGRDPEVAKLLAEVMKNGLKIGTSAKEIEQIRKLVQSKGNAMRGRTLYLNSKTLACINCHTLEGVGGGVGPDLTRIWETHSIEKIIESIVEPSKEIKEGFQTYQATTKRGQVYQGLKISQTPAEVVLREATGRDVRIKIKDVEELEALKTSLMPESVLGQLSLADFLDLVAFLKDRSAQESLRGLALDFYIVGPFGGDLKSAYEPESKPDPVTAYGTRKWQPAQAEPSGLLNLRSVFNADNISAYALTSVYSPEAQKVRMLVGSEKVRIWINGKQVHEHTQMRAVRRDEDKVSVELKAGWNTVLIKVVNDRADHGLYLRFVGTGLRVSRSPVPVGKPTER